MVASRRSLPFRAPNLTSAHTTPVIETASSTRGPLSRGTPRSSPLAASEVVIRIRAETQPEHGFCMPDSGET